MGFWEEDHRGEVPFSSHPTRSQWLSLLMLALTPLLKCLSHLHCRGALLPFPNCLQPYLRVMLSSLRGSIYLHYLEFFCMEDFFFFFFLHPFIYIAVDSWMLILCLVYNPILLYFVTQLVPDLVPGSSFIWLLCPIELPVVIFSPPFLS